MVEIDFPETGWVDGHLYPERRKVRQAHAPELPRLERRLSLRIPAHIVLTQDLLKDQPQLLPFFQDHKLLPFFQDQQKEYDFYLVHLGCSFKPAEGEAFSEAALKVELTRTDGLDSPLPIAWSMDPKRLQFPLTVSHERSARVSLGLIGGVLGPEASSNRSDTHQGEDLFLVALDEGQSVACWQFYGLKGVKLIGSHDLYLTIQTPKRSVPRGAISISAVVERRGFISRYRAVLPEAPALEFDVH